MKSFFILTTVMALSIQVFAKDSFPQQLVERKSMQLVTFNDGKYDTKVIAKAPSLGLGAFEKSLNDMYKSNKDTKVRLKGYIETTNKKGAVTRTELANCKYVPVLKEFEPGLRSVAYNVSIECANQNFNESLGQVFFFKWMAEIGYDQYYGVNQMGANHLRFVVDEPREQTHSGLYYALGGKNSMKPETQIVVDVKINENDEFSVLNIAILNQVSRTKTVLSLQ